MKRFTLTEEHVKLLRASNVRWSNTEYGAACIDPKRPYGNSGLQVLHDMAEILGVQTVEVAGGEERVLERDAKRLRELHQETATALQIVLATGSFEPGEYVADDYKRNWRVA